MSTEISDQKKKGSSAIGILFMAVFIDLLGFGIIIPILPKFTTVTLDQTAFVYGLLPASYSFMQFISAPLWGKLSDRKGRKPIIMIGLTGSVIGFSLLTLALTIFQSIEMLFFARIVSGVFTGATLPTAQAFIVDSTTKKDRAKGFGMYGAAFGLGFTLGPALGGILALVNIGLAPLAATILACINLIWAIKELPETLTDEVKEKREQEKEQELSKNDLLHLLKKKPTLPIVMLMFSTLTFAFVGMETTILLLGLSRFHMTDFEAGLVLLVAGVVAIIVQGGLIRPLSKKYQDIHLSLVGLLFLIIGFLGLTTVHNELETMFWVIPIAFGSSIGTPTLASLLSKQAPETQAGEILGVNSGLASLMRVIGPIVATALFEFNDSYPYYLSAIMLAVTFLIGLLLIRLLRKYTDVKVVVDCLNCGHQLVHGDAFCQYCGHSVN